MFNLFSKPKSFKDRDVRKFSDETNRHLTMLHAEGGVKIPLGHYVTEKDVQRKCEEWKDIRFSDGD